MCVCVCVYWWERLHPSFINWILFGRLGKEEHAIDWFIHSFPHTSHLHTNALKHTHKHATLEERYYWIETLWHPLSHRPAQCSAKLSLPLSVIICMCGQSKTHKGNKIFSVYSPETRIDGRKYRKWHLRSDMFFFPILSGCVRNVYKWGKKYHRKLLLFWREIYIIFVFQVPDNAVMALVPKQVTAYNSVNNSTVSRTSASKYGKPASFCTISFSYQRATFLARPSLL